LLRDATCHLILGIALLLSFFGCASNPMPTTTASAGLRDSPQQQPLAASRPESLILPNYAFEPGKAKPTSEGRDALDRLAANFAGRDGLALDITAGSSHLRSHVSRGQRERLATARGSAIADYLRDRNIPLLEVRVYGSDQDLNHGPQGRYEFRALAGAAPASPSSADDSARADPVPRLISSQTYHLTQR
jgi:hypothetical protein